MQPQVSILIPCYNAEKWLPHAIESALNQTYAHKEVIVIDDGSTDGSLEVIKSFGDRIIWQTQPNQGGNVTRNRLLELSHGEWLQYLDADDYLLNHKIETQINCLFDFPEADVLCSPVMAEYYENGKVSIIEAHSLEPYDPWILLARWKLPQTGGSLWRKQALTKVEGWKIDQPCCQEHELYLRLLIDGCHFIYSDEVMAVYRLWSNSTVSKRVSKSEIYTQRLAIKDKIEAHLNKTGELTELRQNEINQARFQCARILYGVDRQLALKIIEQVRKTKTDFQPSSPKSKLYHLLYNTLGFDLTEKLAAMNRTMFSST